MSNNLLLYEKNQRIRALTAVIWIVLIASAALGALNVQYQAWSSVTAMFGLAVICIPLLWLNSKGYHASKGSAQRPKPLPRRDGSRFTM